MAPSQGPIFPGMLSATSLMIHRRSWPNLEAVELATLDWVDRFNHKRLLGPIGNIPPAEAEAVYYQQQRELALAA